MKHKHYDLIVAWANGAEIEFWNARVHKWERATSPQWSISGLYRIKPEPKPDIVLYGMIILNEKQIIPVNAAPWLNKHTDNLKLIFDGETRELKSAEVIVTSRD